MRNPAASAQVADDRRAEIRSVHVWRFV